MSGDINDFRGLLAKVGNGRSLTLDEAERAFDIMTSGDATPAQIPSTSSQLRYMPLAHAELLPEPGTMVVSVSRNTTEIEQIPNDPSLYRPEFLRIDLP